MRTFFDSSAFAKRYIEESGSQLVEDLCMTTSALGLSVICVPEILSALNRRVRERTLARRAYGQAKQNLAADVHDAAIIQLTPNVIADSTAILETCPIRAMDALHVACALQWKAERFVSSDKRQTQAAEQFGLCVQFA